MCAHVEMRGVSKEFYGKVALDNVDLSVQYGDFFALVGPNGAGKTTLLRIIDLLEKPSSGEVWLDGERIDYSRRDLHVFRRKIGFVPQRPILFNASVFDNIAYGLKFRGLSSHEIKERIKRTLDLVQLSGFERRNALKLSGGEMQRVSLAQALVTEPRLLLLDEPTSNLDPKSASIIEKVLLDINTHGMVTVIMASHDLQQVKNLAKRIAILNRGRIVKIGSPNEILVSPIDELAEYMRLENVFSGFSRVTEYGTSVIEVSEELKIEAAFIKTGPIRIHVPPESITLLTEKVPTSARNFFEGEIFEISDQGNIIKVRVRVRGGGEFTAKITRKSLEEMKLNIGKRIFISFKASSVKII
ncbi:MAG: ABC transporter ATP-binding protein [Candidatus Bathyarchaeia archaeon]|nr:ABC transporter ATP-binding protein [Candidatus Bathyarchaeota archaeon]